jgi:hypothetical protein
MIVIIRQDSFELIRCKQDIKAAWRYAHKLIRETGCYR